MTAQFQDMLNTLYYINGTFDVVGINVDNYAENLDQEVLDIILSGQQAPIMLDDEEIGRIAKYVIEKENMRIIMAVLKHQKKKFDTWLLSLGQQQDINTSLIQ